MSTQVALVMIDLQQEFLSHTGYLKRPVSMSSILEPLQILTDAAREAGHMIVWITSEYAQCEGIDPKWPEIPDEDRFKGVPLNSKKLASAPQDKPCCVRGTDGVEVPPEVKALQHEDDVYLVKDRYSAFGGCSLFDVLQGADIKKLFVSGVTTDLGVRATCADAFFHGFDVTVVSDCVASTRANLHRNALAAMQKHYARVEPVVMALTRWKSVRRGLGAGDTMVMYGVLPDALQQDDTLYEQVKQEVPWEHMEHRGGVVPRLVCLQGDVHEDGTTPMYRHPADEQPVLQPYTPWIERLRDHCQELISQPLNHILIQRYLDGMGYISPHSDKTLDIQRGTAIVGLSLGATRTMILQPKVSDDGAREKSVHLELPHGSLFILGWETNQQFMHGINRDKRAIEDRREDELRDGGERISLTMRHVATFLTADGHLYGQGALRKTRDALNDLSYQRFSDLSREEQCAQAEGLLAAFGAENLDTGFDWDEAYGQGFDAPDLGVLREEEEE